MSTDKTSNGTEGRLKKCKIVRNVESTKRRMVNNDERTKGRSNKR